jgi:hypothetical protein
MSPYQVMLRKDVRRLALPLGLWLVLLAAQTYFNLTPPPVNLSPKSLSVLWEIWKSFGTLLYWISTIFIAAAVVLEDPPRGTEAFWRTRPFPRGSVLAAKLTVLAILTLVPLAVSAVCLALAKVNASDIALATLSAFLERGMIPLAAATVAATTESFGKFALTAIFLLIGSVMVTMLSTALVFFTMVTVAPGAIPKPNLENAPTLLASKTLAAQAFFLMASASLLIWRYRQRHIRFFLGYVIVVALVCPVFPSLWRWDFLRDRDAEQRIEVPMVHGVRFSVKVEPYFAARTFSTVAIFNAVSPNSSQEIVPLSFSDAWFRWPNGDQAQVTQSNGAFPPFSLEDGSPDLLGRAVAPATILNPPERHSTRFILNVPSPMARDRLLRESAVFQAHVEAAAIQCEVAGELPLQTGSRTMIAGRNTTLLESTQDPAGEFTVTIRQGWLSGALATALHRDEEGSRLTTNLMGIAVSSSWRTPIYLLVNRTRQQALIGKEQQAQGFPPSGVGAYSLQTSTLTFDSEVLDPAWLKDAVLVCLKYRRVGTAAGTVESAPLNLSR